MKFTNILPVRLFLLVVFLFCAFSPVKATDYFISNNGNDNNPGTNQLAPFQNISRLNQLVFAPGDRIFFHRGEVFRGQLRVPYSGTTLQPIQVDAYATGEEPVIKGSEYLNSWTAEGGGVYKASLAADPAMVFQNGTAQTLARYPNTGFLKIDAATGNTSFTDNDLNFADQYFAGANVHIRTTRFRYDERVVQSFSNKIITMQSPTPDNLTVGIGYFFTNKKEFIDIPTEYFYDKNTGTIEIKTANGQIPGLNEIEVNVYDYGIFMEGSNIQVRNLKFQHQRKVGVNSFAFGSNILVNNCIFSDIFGRAFNIIGKENVTIQDNYITDMWGGGFALWGCSNMIIERNQIRRIGIGRPGIATDGLVPYFGGILDASSGVFRYNIMDSIGYDCLTLWRNTLVEKNIFTNFCMTTDDGAAIYIGGPYNGGSDGITNGTGCVLRNNIIKDFVGNGEATNDPERTWVNGIFMDEWSGNAVIQNNTVLNSPGVGIFIFNSVGNNVNNNTVFDCRQAAISVGHTNSGPTPAGNVFTSNILYSLHDGDYSLSLANYNGGNPGNIAFGTFNNNYYLNPYTATPVYTAFWDTKNSVYQFLQFYHGADEWKTTKDNNAKFSVVNWKPYEIAAITGPEILPNGNFNTDLTSWECWAGIPGNTCSYEWASTGPLDGGQVHLTSLWDDYGAFHNDRSAMFSVSAGQEYLLRYSVIGNENKTHGVTIYDGVNYTGLSPVFIEPVSTTRTEHNIIFKPTGSSSNSMVGFRVGPDFISSYWLDNISLLPVTTRQVDPREKNFIYVNPTDQPKIFYLTGAYQDIDGNPVSGSITVDPWSSRILMLREVGTVLPISIRDLRASVIDAHSSLVEWQSEATTVGCTVEVQKSANGADFATIGTVQTQTVAGNRNYSFKDSSFNTTSYYRLKSYCPGEQHKYTSTVRLFKDGQGGQLVVYPNPLVTNNFQVLNPGKFTTAFVTGYDGRIVKRYTLRQGTNNLLLDKPAGIYFITFQGAEGSETQRLIKMN